MEIIIFIQIQVFAYDFCGWNQRGLIQNIGIKAKSDRVREGNIPPYCVGFIPVRSCFAADRLRRYREMIRIIGIKIKNDAIFVFIQIGLFNNFCGWNQRETNQNVRIKTKND